MLNKRLRVARDVTVKLHRFEKSIDETIDLAANLIKATATGRSEARLTASSVHNAIELTGDSMQSLLKARRQIIEAHEVFATLRDELGIPATGSGDLWKLPPPGGSADEAKPVANNIHQIG